MPRRLHGRSVQSEAQQADARRNPPRHGTATNSRKTEDDDADPDGRRAALVRRAQAKGCDRDQPWCRYADLGCARARRQPARPRLCGEGRQGGRFRRDRSAERQRILRDQFCDLEARRDTDVADLVRNTLESYRFEIEQNGFHFEQKIDNNLPPLRIDREAIARSLLNLVNNAVKYSAAEKYLGVYLYRRNDNVNLEVIDHGIGIPVKEHDKIFDKFYRVGDPLVHNTRGSGLGLSLVRHIVQAHGGEVAVESEPGQGSKFIITLPVEHTGLRQAKGISA